MNPQSEVVDSGAGGLDARSVGRADAGAILAGLLIVSAYYLSQLSLDPFSIPSTYPDAWQVVWNAWLIGEWLRTPGASLYWTPLVFHPDGAGLFLHSYSEGLLIPLRAILWAATPQTVFKAASLIALLANLLAAYILFKELSKRAALALALALAYVFHPYFVGHLHAGHLNLITVFPIILALHALLLAVDDRLTRARSILVGLCLGWMFYVNLYSSYSFVILLALIIPALTFSRRLTPRGLLRFALPAGLAALLLAQPKVAGMLAARDLGEYAADRNPAHYVLHPLHLALPGKSQAAHALLPLEAQNHPELSRPVKAGSYLGISILFLLLYGSRRLRGQRALLFTFVSAAGCFIILAFGPKFRFLEGRYSNYFYEIPAAILPLFPSVPARFMEPAVLLLFAAAALSAGAVFTGARLRTSPLFICWFLCLAIEFCPAGLTSSSMPPSSALEKIARDPSVRALLDTDPVVVNAMARQMQHGKAIGQAYLARRPVRYKEKFLRNSFVVFVRGGAEQDAESLERGWAELEIQAVLADPGDAAQSARLAAIPWLNKCAEDEHVAVYQRNCG